MKVKMLLLVLSVVSAGAAPLIHTSSSGSYDISVQSWVATPEGWPVELVSNIHKSGSYAHPTQVQFSDTAPILGSSYLLEANGQAMAHVWGGSVNAYGRGSAFGPAPHSGWLHGGYVHDLAATSSASASASLEDELTLYGTGPGARLLVTAVVSAGHSFEGEVAAAAS